MPPTVDHASSSATPPPIPTGVGPAAAFLSYGRQDLAIARLLERDLRRFARPVFGRARLRVVRDQLNLRPSEDLWASIQAQLAACSHLLLLTSSASAGSPWVDREAAHFVEIRGVHAVVLAVVGGELSWDDDAGRFAPDRTTALPPALLAAYQTQPLYVDLRWTAGVTEPATDPRWRAALLDIVSAVTGLDKEAAVAADAVAQRRAIRLAWSAAAVLAILFAAASVLGLLAYRAAQLAERRLRSGQDHVGQLLGIVDGELARARGAGPGRRALLEQSGILLDRLGRSGSPAAVRAARVLDALRAGLVGADAAHRGDAVQAAVVRAQARRAATALAQASGAGERMSAATALTDTGTASFELDDLDGAVADLERARTLREDLWRAQPDPARTLDLAVALDRLGRVHFRRGELDVAAALHQRGLDLVQHLPADALDPTVRALALAQSELLLFDLAEARDARDASHERIDRIQRASDLLDGITDTWRTDVTRTRLDLALRAARVVDDGERGAVCSTAVDLAFDLFASEGEAEDGLRLGDALAECPVLPAARLEAAAVLRGRLTASPLRMPRLEAVLLASEAQSRAVQGDAVAPAMLVAATDLLERTVASSAGDTYLRSRLARLYQFRMSIPDPPPVPELFTRCLAAAPSAHQRIDCRITAAPMLAARDVDARPPTTLAEDEIAGAIVEATAIDDGSLAARLRTFQALMAGSSMACAQGHPSLAGERKARARAVLDAVASAAPDSPVVDLFRRQIEAARC